jgi:site-specific DNA-methyltransferase (adenine-specific)
MNKSWDKSGIANNIEVWKQAYRVLKPGGHMLAFSGTRTYHRMVCAIEDAGFEIRDQLAWIYGSGFPKSQNVGKMIDKKAGAKRKIVGNLSGGGAYSKGSSNLGIGQLVKSADGNHKDGRKTTPTRGEYFGKITEPATQDAKKWDGWGTALKPAQEPIVLARKPLGESTVAKNIVKYGTGAINIDECRISTDKDDIPTAGHRTATFGTQQTISGGDGSGGWEASKKGRWPANIIHDGSEEVMKLFPDTGKATGKIVHQSRKRKGFMLSGSEDNVQKANSPDNYGDGGSAARFFYCAKANKNDRDEGLDDFEDKYVKKHIIQNEGRKDAGKMETSFPRKNNHPTVKPTELMKYLIKLITPKHGVVLDPFMGSGSTGKAAMLLGNKFIGIDMTKEYIPIAENRISHALSEYKKEHISDAFFDNV